MTELRNSQVVLKAAAYAAAAHTGQKRKTSDDPYIDHPLRVAYKASQAGLSDEAVTAALLHDVLEDTPLTREDLAREFPARVLELVDLLTQWWPDDAPAEIKASETPKYVAAILRDQDAIQLKLLDRADNLLDMACSQPKYYRWARRYLERTETELRELYLECRDSWVRNEYQAAIQELKRVLMNDQLKDQYSLRSA